VSFNGPNLVSHAGLLQAASLWQRLGMPGVVARGLRLPGSVRANSDAKVATVVMGMLGGAEWRIGARTGTPPGARYIRFVIGIVPRGGRRWPSEATSMSSTPGKLTARVVALAACRWGSLRPGPRLHRTSPPA